VSAPEGADGGGTIVGKRRISGENQTGIIEFDATGDIAAVASMGAIESDGPSVSVSGDALVV
jgi:hypothetical protein